MTLYPTIIFKVGDAKPIDYQCTTWDAMEQQMTPYDLTNCDVYFTMWDSNSNVIIDNAPATVDIATSGWVYYEMDSLYTATADMYRFVFSVEDSTGHTLNFPEYDVQSFLVLGDGYM
jgi:hypothetical protein